jgi:mono/diheme cytochrome c family protein
VLRALDRGLALVAWLAAALVVVLLFAGPSLIGADKEPAAAAPAQQGETETAASGAAVFDEAGCGSCHTLAAAGATGSIGPDLDQLAPAADAVAAVVRSGRGTMPAFEGRLEDAEIAAVADYVAESAGG